MVEKQRIQKLPLPSEKMAQAEEVDFNLRTMACLHSIKCKAALQKST